MSYRFNNYKRNNARSYYKQKSNYPSTRYSRSSFNAPSTVSRATRQELKVMKSWNKFTGSMNTTNHEKIGTIDYLNKAGRLGGVAVGTAYNERIGNSINQQYMDIAFTLVSGKCHQHNGKPSDGESGPIVETYDQSLVTASFAEAQGSASAGFNYQIGATDIDNSARALNYNNAGIYMRTVHRVLIIKDSQEVAGAAGQTIDINVILQDIVTGDDNILSTNVHSDFNIQTRGRFKAIRDKTFVTDKDDPIKDIKWRVKMNNVQHYSGIGDEDASRGSYYFVYLNTIPEAHLATTGAGDSGACNVQYTIYYTG